MTHSRSKRKNFALQQINFNLNAGVSAVDTPGFLCLFHCVVLQNVKRREYFLKRRKLPKGVGDSDRLIQAVCC
jgi:hypothetical protein